MEIKKYKKVALNKYKVSFDDNELILYEDIILKYELLKRKNIDLESLEQMIEDNKEYEAYDLALKYLGVKMRNKKEIFLYLKRKNFNDTLIESAINKLEKEGYLNENVYINAYITDQINLKQSGPYKIKNDLVLLGFDEEKINTYLNKIDNNIWEQKIKKYIDKHLKQNKKYSLSMLKQRMLEDLYNKGYDKEMISAHFESLKYNNDENLLNEYNKAYKKYSLKFEGRELENKIVIYLERKGYSYNEIKKHL